MMVVLMLPSNCHRPCHRLLLTAAALCACASLPAHAAGSSSCNFEENMDWQMKAPDNPDLSQVDAKSSEECCQHCLDHEGCAFAAWNGPEFHTVRPARGS